MRRNWEWFAAFAYLLHSAGWKYTVFMKLFSDLKILINMDSLVKEVHYPSKRLNFTMHMQGCARTSLFKLSAN
jgi:hypothetical protein